MTSEGPDTSDVSGPSAPGAGPARPDVIVLCLDSLRADHVGPGTTPNLWRLAERGVRFPRAWAEFPLTVPFRISAVSGTYTFTNRPWSGLRPSDRHVAELFSAAGYDTAAFTDTPFRSDVGMHRGFATFEEFPGKLRTAAGPDRGERRALPEPWMPDHRADDRERWRAFHDGWLEARAAGRAGVGPLVERSLTWLGERRDRRPQLLWLDVFECHEPWLSPDHEHRARTGRWPHERFLPLPPGPADDWMRPDDRAQVLDLYRAEVAHTDAEVGRLLDHLDRHDAWAHTVVVAFSDHGVPLGEHGRVRKYDVPLYDEMARIPWIVAAPGARAGHVATTPAQPPDLLATLVELCGLEVPAPTAYGEGVDFPGGLEGHSLVPELGGRPGTREHAFMGVFGTRAAVVRWPHKFIDRRGEGPNELYDLEVDPTESIDLAGDRADLASDLHRTLWRFQHRWARALRV